MQWPVVETEIYPAFDSSVGLTASAGTAPCRWWGWGWDAATSSSECCGQHSIHGHVDQSDFPTYETHHQLSTSLPTIQVSQGPVAPNAVKSSVN